MKKVAILPPGELPRQAGRLAGAIRALLGSEVRIPPLELGFSRGLRARLTRGGRAG
jgi:hypothetical protein